MEEKFFVWYDSGREGPVYGPHYHVDEVKFGKKLYHSLDDLLAMRSISDSIKKRINGAKVGTKIKIQYYHSDGDLMVKRITESERKTLDIIDAYYKKINILNAEVNKLETDVRKLTIKFGKNS